SSPSISPSTEPLAPRTKWACPAASSTSTNVVLPPNTIPANGLICHSAHAGRGISTKRTTVSHLFTYWTPSFENKLKNNRANGDTLISPSANGSGLTRRSLFASRIIVSPFDGSVTTSDEPAPGLTPNCQTTGSPPYV